VIHERWNVMLKTNSRYVVRCTMGLLLAVFLAGCGGEGSQAILDLVPLEMKLVAEYGASNIVAGLQEESTLGVTVVDDASRSLTRDQRAEQAREIAEFVCDNYRSIDRIAQVRVSFEIGQNSSVVDTTDSVTFAFARSELACGGK
jgi:hypothetical protein